MLHNNIPLFSTALRNDIHLFVCLLLFCILTTSDVISGWIPTCDSVHSWQIYHSASLGNQATSTMIWYSHLSHYPDTEPTNPFLIVIILSAKLWSSKYQLSSQCSVRSCHIQIPRSPKTGDRNSFHLATPSSIMNSIRVNILWIALEMIHVTALWNYIHMSKIQYCLKCLATEK